MAFSIITLETLFFTSCTVGDSFIVSVFIQQLYLLFSGQSMSAKLSTFEELNVVIMYGTPVKSKAEISTSVTNTTKPTNW